MRRAAVGLLLGVGFVSLASSRPASAEVFHESQALEPGNFMLGFEGEVGVDPRARGTKDHVDYLSYAHFGAGIGENTDLGFKVSFFDPTTYFGGDVQWMLLPNGEGYPGLSVNAGGHWKARPKPKKDYGGLDGTLTISETIKDQVIFGGYDIDYDFVPELNRPVPIQHMFLGLRIVVSEHLSFFVEGGYGIQNRSVPLYHYVSGGPTLFF